MSNRYNRYDRHDADFPLHNAGARVELLIRRGETQRRVREVNSPVFTLGTAVQSDMRLGDQQFAELHCYICVRNGMITLRQVSETPLITVNGRAFRWGELMHGDRIRTGPYEFQLRVGATPVRTELEESASPHLSRQWFDVAAELQDEFRSPRISPSESWRGPTPRWRSITIDKGFSIRAK